MADPVELAYSRRAQEYIQLLGSMARVHPLDQRLVALWAGRVEGHVIDAGCGPGHWTGFLRELGVTAIGVDPVPAFIDSARSAYPESVFRRERMECLGADSDSVGGVLSWYSLIHHLPDTIHRPLREFRRVLRPGGELMLGFFEGDAVEKFEHAVAPAYSWPVSVLGDQLKAAGFHIIETHTRTAVGHRPHAAIHARRDVSDG